MKKNKDKRIIVGEIQKSKKGFGFIRCEEGDDVFVSQDNMGSAMNGDIVEADLLPECYWEKSPEAIITKVVTRKHQEVVGTFEKSKRFGFVVPDDKKLQDDIYVKKDCFRNAQKRR
jgi:Exoribonuclease R